MSPRLDRAAATAIILLSLIPPPAATAAGDGDRRAVVYWETAPTIITADPAVPASRISVVFAEEMTPLDLRELERELSISALRPISDWNVVTFEASDPESAISSLQRRPNVTSASRVALGTLQTADPMYGEEWWLHNIGQQFYIGTATLLDPATGLERVVHSARATAGHDIRWEEARSLPVCNHTSCTGSGVTVAVIDSGVDAAHPELQGQISQASASFDPLSATVDDTNGHGTFIAGLIAARADNNLGIVGVAPEAKILAVKEDLMSDNVARAIRYAANQGASVMNLSFGFTTPPADVRAAINYAAAPPFNVIIVAAAGNDATKGNPLMYPASFPHVVSVASIDPDGTRSYFSESNQWVDLAAPGGMVTSLVAQGSLPTKDCRASGTPLDQYLRYKGRYDCVFTDGQNSSVYYASESGTSFSAPIVAAGAALARQKWPTLTSDEFELLVRATADLAPGQTGVDYFYGAGTLNLQRLLSFNFPPDTASAITQFTQSVVSNAGTDSTQLAVQFVNREGASDMSTVEADFSPFGLNPHQAMALQQESAGILSYASPPVTIPSSVAPGSYPITVRLADAGGFSGSLAATLTVTPASQTSGQLVVSMPVNMTVQAGTEANVPVMVSNLHGLRAFSFSVVFDPSKLTFSRTQPSTDTPGLVPVTSVTDAPNGMKELMFGATLPAPLTSTASGVVTNLVFTVNESVSGNTTLELRNPTDGFAGAQMAPGSLVISGTAITTPINPTTPIAPVPGPATTPLTVSITGPKRGEDFSTKKKTVVLRGEIGADVASITVKDVEQAIAPGTTTWTATVPLSEGENAITITAWDVAKARQAQAMITIARDTEAPDDVEKLKATPDGAKTRLSWKAPEDDIEGYHVYRVSGDDFEEIDVTRSRSYLADGAGPFAVTAEDKAGNESDPEDGPQVFGGRETGFRDVPASHFASAAVATLRERGIVEGRDGAFAPNDFVTRAEFAKMLAGVRGVSVDSTTTSFRDVSKRSPLAGHVAAIVGQGWARGEGANFFPNRPVTRMEAARMIVRAASLPSGGSGGFTDVAAGEELGIATALKSAGIASGQNGQFMPGRPVTRAEAAKMLAAILKTI